LDVDLPVRMFHSELITVFPMIRFRRYSRTSVCQAACLGSLVLRLASLGVFGGVPRLTDATELDCSSGCLLLGTHFDGISVDDLEDDSVKG
jgi:hypothetical protein